MIERNYNTNLEIEEFGAYLFKTEDLDPVYVALYKLSSENIMDKDHLNRWLLAYILFYHCGVASFISEKKGAAFWEALHVAAVNTEPTPIGGRWPRAHERRHFRGQFAVDAVARLKGQYGNPEEFIQYIAENNGEELTFSEVSKRVREHHAFGGWAAFKLADMIERLGIALVSFQYDDVVIYKDPVEAAKMIFRQRNMLPSNADVKPHAVRGVFEYLIQYFKHYRAPPTYDRPVGVQEIETCCCKLKSYRNGRYPLGNDIHEIREGLVPWAKISETALNFQQKMPVISTMDQEFIK